MSYLLFVPCFVVLFFYRTTYIITRVMENILLILVSLVERWLKDRLLENVRKGFLSAYWKQMYECLILIPKPFIIVISILYPVCFLLFQKLSNISSVISLWITINKYKNEKFCLLLSRLKPIKLLIGSKILKLFF